MPSTLLPGASRPAPSAGASTDFRALGVPAPLVDSLARDGVTSAFPIQTATLPDSLAGRDVLGRGKTGSGKTIAFALPTVAALAASCAEAAALCGKSTAIRSASTQLAAPAASLSRNS